MSNAFRDMNNNNHISANSTKTGLVILDCYSDMDHVAIKLSPGWARDLATALNYFAMCAENDRRF